MRSLVYSTPKYHHGAKIPTAAAMQRDVETASFILILVSNPSLRPIGSNINIPRPVLMPLMWINCSGALAINKNFNFSI